MAIRAAIFDMDGTLIDSMGGWVTAGERYLRAKGFTPRFGKDDSLMTQGMRGFAAHVQRAYGVTDGEDAVIDDINRLMASFYQTEPTVKEGLVPFLEALSSRGVRMCVATATARALAEPTLERLGLLPFFERIFVCRELQTDKLSPLIYDIAAAALGADKEDTWVFEDAAYAARTVHRAGYPLCGVADRFEPRQDLVEAVSDVYITSYAEATERLL